MLCAVCLCSATLISFYAATCAATPKIFPPVLNKMALHPEYKIILLGDPRVGKTTFFLRIKEGDFVDTELRPTASLGVEHLEFQHKIGGVDVKVSDPCMIPYLMVHSNGQNH